MKKKFLSIVLVAVMLVAGVFLLTGCGNETEKENGKTTGGSSSSGTTGEESGTASNVSEYTKATESFVDKYDYAEEYMIPDDGVYTGYYSQANDRYFYFVVNAITKKGLENYKEKLLSNGFEYKNAAYINESKNIKITISNYTSTGNYITVYVYPSINM